jgi:acyl-CoA synthetase (AMP-forming)/AMP-acid ligase II
VAATLDDRAISYRELDVLANRMAHSLIGSGVAPGQVVAWWCTPSLDTVAGFAAVARTGAVFAPLNPAFRAAEANSALRYLHPSVLVVDESHEDVPHPAVALEELAARSSNSAPVPVPGGFSDADPHVIYLTSGTTGRPKGVVVSHRASWLRSFPGGSTFAAGLRGPGGILASFPLFHYGGFHYVLEAWHYRRAFHVCRRFDGDSLLEAATRWRPVGMYCIPAVWNRVLEASPSGSELSSVRHADTGTSAAPLELLLRLRDRMPNATTSVHYGSSEGGHHSTLHDRDVLTRPGSVGQAAPPGVIRLSDEEEILYRSPTLMDGYFEMPEESASALEGGWYHTGDLGAIDEDGYLYVTGRAKEMIRTGGEYVSPAEVEGALAGLPGVTDVAVVGAADEQWGEVVCAAVVVPAGSDPPTMATLHGHLGDRLARYKHPRRVVVVSEIPRTPATGQVQRTLLRELVMGDV